ncbi:MAG TPA: hypothetical protein PLP75_12415 [Burkholderiales bacterium]|nr:hypothetical protein [Burkholderiales bacterium]
MNNFCTLFDSNFLLYGLALYESLQKNCKNFHLYIFAFNDECYDTLTKLNLANVTVIPLAEFEDPQLLAIKPSRTRGEYCWTCSSSTILYCLKRYNLSACTYLDADLYFYNDPSVLIDEMKDNDVLITEHRYTPQYDQSTTSGVYCVQFMTFKNTENGLRVLNWWRNACIEWCYNRFEDGKFGDQKYLDDWTRRFSGVHVLEHLGGGVAPWNLQQYKLLSGHKLADTKTSKHFNLIFFHFHDVKIINNVIHHTNLLSYDKNFCFFNKIYIPYIKTINIIINKFNLENQRIKTPYFKLFLYILRKQAAKVKHGIFT